MKPVPASLLMDGNVTIRVTHSTLNYKDGLALTGRAPVVRRFPMIPGIDGAGIVETSEHPDFQPGDRVIQKVTAAGRVIGCATLYSSCPRRS